jgi:hypothetical protein
MNEVPTSHTGSISEVQHYEIRVRGHLAPRWADWFDGMTLTSRPDGTTVLDGPVTDQAELHGLLRRLSDLGLPLVSLSSSGPSPTRTTDPA